jgi:hypothetical protein
MATHDLTRPQLGSLLKIDRICRSTCRQIIDDPNGIAS